MLVLRHQYVRIYKFTFTRVILSVRESSFALPKILYRSDKTIMGPRTEAFGPVVNNNKNNNNDNNTTLDQSTTDSESFCIVMDDNNDDDLAFRAFQRKSTGGKTDGPMLQFPPVVISEDVNPVSVHYLQSALVDLKNRFNLKEEKCQTLERETRDLRQQLNYAMSRRGNSYNNNGLFQSEAIVAQGAAAQEAVVPQGSDVQEMRAYITNLSQNSDIQQGHNRRLEVEIVALQQQNKDLTLKLQQILLDSERLKLECDNCKENSKTIGDLQSRLSALQLQLKVKNNELLEKTRLLANTPTHPVVSSSTLELQGRGLALSTVSGGSLSTRDALLSNNDAVPEFIQQHNTGTFNSAELQKIDVEVERCRENFRHLQQEVDKQSVIARYLEACSGRVTDDDNASICSSSVSSADEASSALSSDFFYTGYPPQSSNVHDPEHTRPTDYRAKQILQTNQGVDEITYGVNKLNVGSERLVVPLDHLGVAGHRALHGSGSDTFAHVPAPNIANLYNPGEMYNAEMQLGGMTAKKAVERTRSSVTDNRPSPVRSSPRQRPISELSQFSRPAENYGNMPRQIPQALPNVAAQSAANQPTYIKQPAPHPQQQQHQHQQQLPPMNVNQTERVLDTRTSSNHPILRRTSPNNGPPPIPGRQLTPQAIGPPPRPKDPPQHHIIMPQQIGVLPARQAGVPSAHQPGVASALHSGVTSALSAAPSALSAAPSALSAAPLLSPQRQEALAAQVCPICKQDFTQLSMGDFQTHVFDCYDNEDSDGHQPSTLVAIPIPESDERRKVCPMCNNFLPLETSQEEFERHVNGHFEPDFEMVNMPST